MTECATYLEHLCIDFKGFLAAHYAIMPVQYAAIFKGFLDEKQNDIFLIFAQIIDCGYTLEPPH